mgnify:CR=1 FL=1
MVVVQVNDPTYQATKLHFEDLAKRYGSPIIVLNLIKVLQNLNICSFWQLCIVLYLFSVMHTGWMAFTYFQKLNCLANQTVEKRPREMMLRREFATAVGYLNQIFAEGEKLHFIHWDFHKFAKR